MKYKKRKSNRLINHDYTQAGYYFVTICTYKHQCILSYIVGGGFHAAPCVELTEIGNEVEKSLIYVNNNYPNIEINKYVIMPNHIHLIVILKSNETMGRHGNLPLQNVIGQLKSYTTRQFNKLHNNNNLKLWQRNYHDHIIRNEKDYQRIWQYINTNAQKWELDKYYN